ncbi:MAG: ABC transporter substrate-binding protein, partial [Clostridia bacterium]
YTLYGLPQQVSNFFDSFRNGSLPIGVSTFDTFVKLSFAAPEIAGLWNIAMTPGVLNEATGEVERWQTGSSTSVTMMNSGNASKIDASWELLKWWTSSEVQTEFMERLTMIYGNAYIWNSANLSAFANSVSFTEKQKSVILSQWKWMREVPKVPGWYMLERELSNSWNSIVINGENTRAVIEGAVTRIDKEIERKMTEFGYMSGGKIIKPYVITTLEYVKQLKGK